MRGSVDAAPPLGQGALTMKLAVLLLALAYSLSAQSLSKLWTVDLSSDPDFSRRLGISEALLRAPTVDFLNGDQIIVAYDDNEMSIPSPRLTPFGFHVLEVSAGTGKLGTKLSSTVLTNTSQAQATGDGNFLLLAGEKLKKFSSKFKEMASLPVPTELHGQPTDEQVGGHTYLNPRYETWRIDVAPGGHEFVLAHVKNPHEMELTWVRSSDFSTIATVKAVPSNQQGMSAGNQAVWVFPWGWAKLLLQSGDEADLCDRCRRGYFLTDDLFFLDERDKYAIKTTSGLTRATGRLMAGASEFARAASSSRFAYATGKYKSIGSDQSALLAVWMQVRVFDWSTMKVIGEVDFEKSEKFSSSGFKQSAIALSPDGRRLLVLTGSMLSLYELK
jgi:hypothetical protein